MAFIAGKYAATFDPVGATSIATIGQIEQGITIDHVVFKEEIRGDNFAQTVQDSVFQGMGVSIAYTLIEWNATNAEILFWPYGTDYLTMDAVIGNLDSNLVGSLLLTALTGTPAASAPASITLPRVILANGFPVNVLYAPALRKVPIRQTVYPSTQGVFGTMT